MLVKDVQRHPVRGEAVHVDLLRVDMKVAIHTTVTLELHGADDAPGVVEGGVLSQGTIELNIEALPGDIPDTLHLDVSGMEINDTLTLSALTRAGRRHAARRPRRDRPRDAHPADAGAGGGGDRDRDRASSARARPAEGEAEGDGGDEAEQSASGDES